MRVKILNVNSDQIDLLRKMGIVVDNLEFHQKPIPVREMERLGLEPDAAVDVEVTGTFKIDNERFVPMCHLIRITDMICENKNPAVQEMYHELVTMLFLTEKHERP